MSVSAASSFLFALQENWNDALFTFEDNANLEANIREKLLETLNKILLDLHHLDTKAPQYYLLADILEPRKLTMESVINHLKLWHFPAGSIHISGYYANVHIELPKFGDEDARAADFPTAWTLEYFMAGDGQIGYQIRL
eukprot:TRINITY_DN607_c0_g2_i1.p1 TRINITY_DN607_c0_g2~~TRINITY_DN607_c0_g2_i1.p1  ORF type:complete len:139 (+),score=42.15 TRINITY_DN607_c0_g2_i1:195-611(+)